MKRAYKYITTKAMTILACEFSRQVGTSYTTLKKHIIIV